MTAASFINKQYKSLQTQSGAYGFNLSKKTAKNVFTVSGISETALQNMMILTPNIIYNLTIIVLKVGVSITNNDPYSDNILLQTILNDRIILSSTNKSITQPWLGVFGASNVTVNGVADITSELLNDPTKNMVKTYSITFGSLPITTAPLPNCQYAVYSSKNRHTCYDGLIKTSVTTTYSWLYGNSQHTKCNNPWNGGAQCISQCQKPFYNCLNS